MSVGATASATPVSRRAGAWLQLLGLLPAAIIWGGAGLAYALLIASGVAFQYWRAPQAWWLTAVFLCAGLGLFALLSALWPVAVGVRGAYRLARWEQIGVVVGVVVAVGGLLTTAQHVPLVALLQYGLPALIAVHVAIAAWRDRQPS